jgi:uncharacterized OB-fold protein
MSDGGATPPGVEDTPPLEACRYESGAITYPPHPVGPEGSEPAELVDLSAHTGTVVTWTTVTATPPGVREPNHLAVVEFELDGQGVRAIGQLTSGDVETGDEVRPVYAGQLRDPDAGIREPASQAWDGYRFDPLE